MASLSRAIQATVPFRPQPIETTCWAAHGRTLRRRTSALTDRGVYENSFAYYCFGRIFSRTIQTAPLRRRNQPSDQSAPFQIVYCIILYRTGRTNQAIYDRYLRVLAPATSVDQLVNIFGWVHRPDGRRWWRRPARSKIKALATIA